ncbi:porin [Thiohalophilus sp.]|uniref:porin n=1 Tax=Thiohalophilus sp. TaxID=3028392 RepID=UPI002ACE71E6|nr:porin [Thiohalophilus sp.]MDZ7663353.1 porin [Thiohalophilus sp.]
MYHSTLRKVTCLLVCCMAIGDVAADQSEGTYLHRESDAFWLLAGPHARKFGPGQKFKNRLFLKPVYTDSEIEANNSSLELKNARFALWGALSDNTLAMLRLNFDGFNDRFGPPTGDATTNNGLKRVTENTVADAWIEYSFNRHLRVRAGQDVVPYGLNMRTPVALMSFNDRPVWTRQVFARTRLIRDMQLQAFGQNESGNLLYAVGILQGTGIGGSLSESGSGPLEFRLANDNNDKKDIAARLVWATPVQGLSLGASYYKGFQGYNGDPASNYLATGGITDEKHWGVDLRYQHGPLWVTAEYNHSEIDQMIVPQSSGTLIRSGKGEIDDWYVAMRYDGFSKRFSPKIRYEQFDTSSESGAMGDPDRIRGFLPPGTETTVGINFRLPTRARPIKNEIGVEYTLYDEKNAASDADNDLVALYWKVLY